MNFFDYVDYAKMFGYEIKFSGLGMAYIELCGIKLTETEDVDSITAKMARIGMAIMMDTLRNT